MSHRDQGPRNVDSSARLGKNVQLAPFVNIYGCTIGDDTKIGAYVEVAEGVTIGKRCKVAPGALMGPGLTIGDDCYIGPNVIFANVKHPTAGPPKVEPTWVENGVSIGAACVVLPGVRLGENCRIAAGTVVTKDVPAGALLRNKIDAVLSSGFRFPEFMP